MVDLPPAMVDAGLPSTPATPLQTVNAGRHLATTPAMEFH
jgi:hypothetical protein